MPLDAAAGDAGRLADAGVVDPALLVHVPETRKMNELVAAVMPTVPSFGTPEGLAQLRAGIPAVGEPEPCPWAVDCTIPGPDGTDLVLRVLVPPEVTTPAGVYLDFHGGGWCIGSAGYEDKYNVALAEAAGVVVVSVDYRLAPEHRWPAQADDGEAAARWLVDEASSMWGTDRLVIGGHSAGAHLAAVTLLRLRDRVGSVAPFVGANLVYGCYDLGMTPSMRRGHDALVIPRRSIDAIFEHLLPGVDAEGRRDPSISPLYADLDGMPPALFTVGTSDPLLDDSLFMAARWRAAGSPADLAVYPEATHSFPGYPTEMARLANDRIHRFVTDLVTP